MLSSKNYYIYIFISILTFLLLVLLINNINSDNKLSIFPKIIMEIFYPIEHKFNLKKNKIFNFCKKKEYFLKLEEKNKNLQRQIYFLQSQINKNKELYLESLRVKELLISKHNKQDNIIIASIINNNYSAIFKTLMINKGTSHKIYPGMVVTTIQGIVGKIIESSWHSSKVLLITDYTSNIDIIIQNNNRYHGILQGNGNKGCKLKYVENTEEIKIGDFILTSGLGNIFPKGIPIGRVITVEKDNTGFFQKIDVLPIVDFKNLEEVAVLSR